MNVILSHYFVYLKTFLGPICPGVHHLMEPFFRVKCKIYFKICCSATFKDDIAPSKSWFTRGTIAWTNESGVLTFKIHGRFKIQVCVNRMMQFKTRSRRRIFRCFPRCQINMNPIFHISGNGGLGIKIQMS